MRCFATAAAAQRAGFRACKRCRPDASPGSPQWDRRDDAVARAMRAIADGVVDREGVRGLASRLGYSTRQLSRLLISEVGASALQLARAQRAQTARVLLEATDMPAGDVAFAAGFGSVRQFNDTVKTVFGEPPTALRLRAAGRSTASGLRDAYGGSNGKSGRIAGGEHGDGRGATVTVRLAFRPPFDGPALFAFFAQRAVAGVEEGDSSFYRRALRLPHGHGVVTVLAPALGERWARANFVLDDMRDLTAATKRLRRALDLDSDPESVAEVLGPDPVIGPAVRRRPGIRVPGSLQPEELALRAFLGQQVSVLRARALASRLAEAYGERLARPVGGVDRAFPAPETLAGLDSAGLGVPASRGRALVGLAQALAGAKLDLGPPVSREEASSLLAALPGVGPWTLSYIKMRALGDPDAFCAGDLGLRRALERAGLEGTERAALALTERWRPYRAYALAYLWSGEVVGQPTGGMPRERPVSGAAQPSSRPTSMREGPMTQVAKEEVA